MRALGVAALLLVLTAAGGSRAASTSSAFQVRLERTACFGTCPIYSVTVRADGRVVFVGKRFVAATGVRRARLSKAKVSELRKAFSRARVFRLRDRYDDMTVSDLPSALLTVRLGERTKHVYHYLGDSTAPKRLGRLECLVDRIARTSRWIGRPDSVPCERASGSAASRRGGRA
jgi:hypothetical protein